MSGAPMRAPDSSRPSLTLDRLAAEQDLSRTTSVDDLALDVWDTDVELDEFLDDVRRSRHADAA